MQWMNLKNWGIRMKVVLYGYGLMGKKVAHQLREKDEFDLIGVVSYEFDEKAPEAMYSNLTEVQDRADVIIDFSKPENIDHLFDRFYRTDESRNSKTGGYGIGLSVAKAVVEAHHGKIVASSEDGNSLLITVILKI